MVVANKLLNKKMVREIKSNYKQFLSVIMIAALVVALFSGLSTNYYHFNENVESLYTASNIGDYFVTTKSYDEADYSKLKQLASDEGINERFYFQSFANDTKSTIIVANKANTISIPASLNGQMGVLIEENYAISKKIKINDDLKINFSIDYSAMFSQEEYSRLKIFFDTYLAADKENLFTTNNMLLNFKVTGTMTHAEAVSNNSYNGGLIYLSDEAFKESLKAIILETYPYSSNDLTGGAIIEGLAKSIVDFNYINQYVLLNDEDIKVTIDNYFLQKQDNNLLMNLSRKTLPSNQALESDVKSARQLLFVFPIVFYVVGLLVIITSLSQLINKDKLNIGILSALGVGRYRIVMHYAKFAIMLTSIGAIIGLLVGPKVIPLVMGEKYSLLYQIPNVTHPWFYPSYLFCFLLLLVTSVLLTIILSYNIMNLKPAQIIRNMSNDSFKGIFIEKFAKLFGKIGLCLRMSLRNIRRNLSRSIMVIVGVSGCTALLLCGFGIENTLNYGIDKEVNEQINYDLSVVYENKAPKMDYSQIKNIRIAEEYFENSVMAKFENKAADTNIILLDPDFEIFKSPCLENKASITSKLATDLGLKVGDKVTYYLNNQNYDVQIGSIIELCFTQGIILNQSDAPFIYTINRSYIRLYDYNQLIETKNEVAKMSGAMRVLTREDVLSHADDILGGIRIMTLTVKVFAILLAIVVLYNLAQLNFKERVRDIATLKVLGFGKFEIGRTLMYEIVFLTIIGSLCGMVLGMPLLKVVLGINETPLMAYLYHINVSSYLYALLLTIGVSVVINFFISILTDKIEMVESLKSVE